MSRKLSYTSALDFALSVLSQIDPAQVAIPSDDVPVTVGEVCDKLTTLRAKQAARKGTKSDAPTKAQVERLALAERIAELMESGVSYGTAEIAALLPELAGATPQKITPLMKLLGERVVATKVKGKAVYTLA